MKLVLLRHPAADVAPGVCYGASDVPVAGSIPHVGIPPDAHLYSSPLRRCLDLARVLAKNPEDVRIDPRLREMDFGAWEMRSFADVGRAAIDAWAADPLHFRPPGGESVQEMQSRVLAALEDLLAGKAACTVIVSHGGPLRVIAGNLLGLAPADWMRLVFAHAEAYVFERRDGRWHAPSRLLQQLQ